MAPVPLQLAGPVVAEALPGSGAVSPGDTVTLPAGTVAFGEDVPNPLAPGEVLLVPGPTTLERAGDVVTVPEGDVEVLGVQVARQAPNTGVDGEVASSYVDTVQDGDTLESIATACYGDSARASDIAVALALIAHPAAAASSEYPIDGGYAFASTTTQTAPSRVT